MAERVKVKKKKKSVDPDKTTVRSVGHDATFDRVIRDSDIDEIIGQYEEAILIDEHALDNMLVQQPETFYRVSKALALQISRRDAAKQHLQNTEAKVDGIIRRRAAAKNEKLTERDVDSRKRSNEDVIEANNDLMRLNHTVGQLTALKEAFQQRAYVLKDLVGLYIANYYGDNSAGASSSRAKEKAAGDAREALAEERRKRSKD